MAVPPMISWPITGGIATKNAPFMLAPGSHLTLDNVRQERANEWRTRPGFTHNVADDLPTAPLLAQETTWGGLVALMRQTSYGNAARVYSPTAGTRWITPPLDSVAACCQQTPGVWNRRVVGPSTTGTSTITQESTAEGGNYRLTAWSVNAGGSFASIQVTLQTADGATAQSWLSYNNDTSACRPRCVYSSAAGMLVMVYQDGFGQIVAHRWNATTGAFVGATTLSAAAYVGLPQAAYVDAIYYGGATITVVFRNNTAAGQLQIVEFNPATGGIASNVNTGLDCSNNLALFSDPDASGIRMVAIVTAIPEVRVIRLNSVGAVQTNQVAAAVDATLVAGIAYNAGVDWMLVFNDATYARIRAVKRRSGVTSGVVDITPPGRMTTILATGAWREASTDAMRYMMLANGVAADDFQPTFLEMALEFENANANITNTWTEPQARLLSLNAGGFSARGAVPQVFRLAADKFVAPLVRITRNLDTGDNVDGPEYEVDSWTVQYLNSTTYYNQNLGRGCQTQDCTFQPAGCLLQTATGQLLVSHGASAIPLKPVLTPSVGAGTLDNTKTYTYGVSCFMTDENGNAWRSPMSVVASIGPATWAGGNTVTVAVTMTPLENQMRRRVALIWRTDGNGSTFKLLGTKDSTVAQTGSFNYVDTTGDVIGGELFTAEVQAGLTPAFNHTAVWNDRMWGSDRDFPTRIWFSKPLSQGLLPEFVADPNTGVEFSIDIDDEFGPITGLVALDDKLVAFKERAIYVIGGDGPDNAGNGAFPAFARIDQETGNIVGGPIVGTGREAYFTSLGGVYRVSGGQATDFVGAAIDRYLGMPLIETPETVTGMVVSPSLSEVRVQTSGYRFVHDRIFNVWIRDTGGMVAAAGIKLTRMLGGQTQVVFTSQGQMWVEDDDSVTPSDAGNLYAGTIRSAWLRPAGVEGRLQLFKGKILGECTVAGTTENPTLTIFRDNDDDLFETFQPPGSITDTTGPIQAEGQVRHQRVSTFSLQLTLPEGDATVRLDAFAASAVQLPGQQPLPIIKKWRPRPPTLSEPPVGLFWYDPTRDYTIDGSNRLSDWGDQWPNAYHQRSQDITGVLDPATNWPVFTPNAANGLPMMTFNGTTSRMNRLFPGGTLNLPTADGEAITVLSVAKMTNGVGGAICTLRGANSDLEFENMQRGPNTQLMATAQDANAVGHAYVNYQNLLILYVWRFYGAAASPQAAVELNGVDQAPLSASGPLQAYSGLPCCISLGYCNAVFAKYWPGPIGDVMAYRGVPEVTILSARAFLAAKWGITLP